MPTSTVTLSVADDFSRPLDAYAQKAGAAAQASEKLATGMADTDAASQKLAGTMGDASGKLNENAQATQKSSLSLTDIYSAVRLAETGFRALKGAYDETVGTTLTLSDQIRRLSRDIGASAEESSKLIVAADNTGISVSTLTMALDQAIKKGHEPTIANLAKMADKYNAIQDPIARTKFLQDEFGRSGAAMGALMEKGSAGIKAFGDEAEHTGQIMSGDAVKAARAYEVSMNNLNDSITGMKVQIGEALIPTLTTATDVITTHFQALNLANQAMASGAINAGDYAKFIAQMAFNYGDATPQVDFFTKRLDEQKQSTNYLDGAVREYNRSIDDGHAPMADNIGLHQQEADALRDEADKLYALQRAMLDAGSARDVATMQYAKLLQATRDQIQGNADAAQDQLTQIGISGQLTKNEEAYRAVITQNAPKIAELRAEIAKYTAAQGESVTVVNKGQYSAEQLAVAQERLAIAEQRLIEYHGKSQASLDSLTLSVRTAKDTVDKMAGAQATASTSSADYSKKINEDQAALDELTLANGRAADAMHNANKAFVAQTAAVGLTGKALFDVELKLGQIDQPTYDAALAIDTAKQAFLDAGGNDNSSALSQFESKLGILADKINGIAPAADKIPDVLQPATQAFSDAGWQAHLAALDVLNLNEQMAAMHDKTITITVNQRGNAGSGYDRNAGVEGQYAGGANFTVPPGYPNDSYRMNVQSGEHVIVIPAQGGGGSNSNYNVGSVHIHAAPGQSGDQLWAMMSAAAARQTRNQTQAGASVMGN